MDIIAPKKVVVEAEADGSNETPGISAEEREQRKAAIDYARGSVRLEGLIVSPFAEEMNRRYIDGEITRQELTAAILAHCKP
jgi:hypothetical protein